MRKKTQPDAVNLTPMIDVVFQMIIFFVFTLDLEREKFDEKITVPDATRSAKIEEPEVLTIYPQVLKDGRIKMGARVLREDEFRSIVKSRMSRIGGNKAQHIPVMIYADEAARHHMVRRVMDICSQEGLYKISVIGLLEKAPN